MNDNEDDFLAQTGQELEVMNAFHRGQGVIIEEFYNDNLKKVLKEQTTVLTSTDVPEIAPKQFADPPARVSCGQTYKVNMGDYESYSMFIALSLPCKQDEVDATAAKIDAWISDRLHKEMKDADDFALARNGKKRGDAKA